jgi:exopolysaccharide biosynthesis polyprenyl glycosylphosphotransferase
VTDQAVAWPEDVWSPFALGAILRRAPGWKDALLRRFLAVADLLAVALASGAVLVSGYGFEQAIWFLICAPLWVVLAKLQGLYDQDHRSLRHLTVDELPKLATWAIEITIGLALLLVLTDQPPLHLGDALIFAALTGVAVFASRVAARWLWRRITPPERTALIGSGASVTEVRRKLELFADIHVEIVAESDTLQLDAVHERRDWFLSLDRVIVASSHVEDQLIKELLMLCRRAQIKLSLVPPVRGMFGTAVQLNHIADLPIVEYTTWDVSRSTLFLKRLIDIVVCAVVLPLCLPLFALIALAVKIDSRGPVFFTQTRAGMRGRPFRMLKFRTMVCDAEVLVEDLIRRDELPGLAFKFTDDPRVTRVGRVLRRWSLDELPQLINVLRGEMSLVGPRPEQVELVDKYGPEHRFRLRVKPGLTGPMQVYGRGLLSFEERLAVEREYVDNVSLGRDLRLLAMTAAAVVGGRGAL